MSLDLDCTDIIDIFKNHLKIENSVKSISHTFLNQRYAGRINYAPYFQRNYVWDSEKATYFIESILLGTEIPPIVLFDDGQINEVIDGRQRYETIKKFLENATSLDTKGLKVLTNLANLHFSEMPEEIQDSFKNTKIRVLQYSIVNEPILSPEREDKIKKEIFTRYNSGIIALRQQEIERAIYIDDVLVHTFKELLEKDMDFLKKCQEILMPKRKQSLRKRDRINYILSRIRTVLAMEYVPIQSYAGASSKSEVIHTFYVVEVAKKTVTENIEKFKYVIDLLYKVRSQLENKNSALKENNLFYETLYWGLALVMNQDRDKLKEFEINQFTDDLCNCASISSFWTNIDVEKKETEYIFFATGSHYYMSIINRYTFIANYISYVMKMDFSSYLKNKNYFDKVMGTEIKQEQFKEFRLSKPDPVSATVYDILSDVQNSNFIIRPDYQRSEVANATQKASYLLESILLGLRIPPVFIYRRKDGVTEVIDGQQRLLSILGFLREPYKDVNGKQRLSDKNGFKLSKLRFLSELNGSDIDGIEAIDSSYKDRILDFQIDIVEINESQNPNFNPIDLFLRLNSKPFPIEANTFEMWNAYVKKEYVVDIKNIAKSYAGTLFRTKDTRMKNEELITMLAYLAYRRRKNGVSTVECLNIYVKNQRINARITKKNQITNVLGNISRNDDLVFGEAIEDVKIFIKKLQMLTGDNFEKWNLILSHTKKNTQSKTNQNFYLLWIALENVTENKLQNSSQEMFDTINGLFKECQDIEEDKFNLDDFVSRLSRIGLK